MRTKLRSKVTLLFMTCALLLAVPAVALADNIVNSVDPTIDAVAETMPLNQNGANGTTTLYVDPTNGDGKNGCNFGGTTGTLVLAISSSNTSVATVSPSSVTFSGCGQTPTLTVTPHNAGTANINVTQTSNTTGSTFTLAPAQFTVNVAPPANSAPAVRVDGVDAGASYNKGSVPDATCNVTDAEDGPSSFAATLSAITGPYASDGIGSQEASCSYTDGGGLTASSSKTYSIVDPSPPVIQKVVTGTLGNNDWYTSDVSVDWTVSDPESPNSLQLTGCVDQNITSDQAATTYSCSATSAGGSATEQSVTIKRDATAPTIAGSKSPAATSFGWNNGDVLVSYLCSDTTSGVASCGPNETLSSEGANQSSTGNATDAAGNTASDTVSGINIDLTNPLVALVGGPSNGSSHYFGFVPSAPTCTASDALSGLDGACSVSGYGTTVGSHTVTATAKDKAANTNTASNSYSVLAWDFRGFYQPVDMNGVFNTVKGGSTVPFKFELFAGSTELTSTSYVNQPLKATRINCESGATEDIIELTATGSTSLRYDTTGGQYVYNWQTPKQAGACYSVTISAQDGSSQTAYFKLK